ncbi:hypothetical protein AA12717_0372 [Gluconacetobacter sacchari DSM 12717]|uniref:Uncharacterized protein n=2 Tax=Gluconacetobacter sacchari TaxID=92759 RepID=A0A7W4IC24_9PROT|nr:hypothetical protein [Gluconacetobacter sacchari]MBB2160111.1 hypothetical protein [Gluconacetobacter sacchari]GBQ19851.1 hypothetical protein AA12717_0372 [Gluconacetobacter sacchari DSM 12717]
MTEQVRVQTRDMEIVLTNVWRRAQERMKDSSNDINDLLDDGESAINDAVEKYEAGDLRAASDCAAHAAACSLLIAAGMYRLAENVPAKKEMS